MNDNTPPLPPWYLSRTVWVSVTASLLNIANQVGFHVDPFWAESMPDYLLNISWILSAGCAIYLHLRSKRQLLTNGSKP